MVEDSIVVGPEPDGGGGERWWIQALLQVLLIRAGQDCGLAEHVRLASPLRVLRVAGWVFQRVESVLAAKCPEGAFEIVDHGSWSVGLCSIGAETGAEVDVVVDGRFFLGAICEV